MINRSTPLDGFNLSCVLILDNLRGLGEISTKLKQHERKFVRTTEDEVFPVVPSILTSTSIRYHEYLTSQK
jgi:hypothetical protein